MTSGGQNTIARPVADRVETARYLADLSHQMAILARRADLAIVAYLLEVARLAAEETIKDVTPD